MRKLQLHRWHLNQLEFSPRNVGLIPRTNLYAGWIAISFSHVTSNGLGAWISSFSRPMSTHYRKIKVHRFSLSLSLARLWKHNFPIRFVRSSGDVKVRTCEKACFSIFLLLTSHYIYVMREKIWISLAHTRVRTCVILAFANSDSADSSFDDDAEIELSHTPSAFRFDELSYRSQFPRSTTGKRARDQRGISCYFNLLISDL